MSATLIASREALAKALAAHYPLHDRRVYPSWLCSCGEWDGAQGDDGGDADGQQDNADAYRAHVADALLASDAIQTPAEFAAGLADPLCKRICDLLGEPRVLVPGEVSALIAAALAERPTS